MPVPFMKLLALGRNPVVYSSPPLALALPVVVDTKPCGESVTGGG